VRRAFSQVAQLTHLEAFAAVLGVINIVLIARRSVLNYPFGVAMVCLYFVVFADARLYSAAGLQIFFLASQLYGWWYWRRAATGSAPVPVRPITRRGLALAVAGGAIGTLALGLLMSRLTNAAAPWWDATNAAWSMVAQLLTDRRIIESWPLWVAIDILSIGLFASQGLLATAALYVVFLGIACWGWIEWRGATQPA
jgi:nicotinamide mononucleotide transporter